MRVLVLALGLVVGALACAAPEISVLEQDLRTAEQGIGEAQVELRAALEGHDQETARAVGSRLRGLKVRREQFARELAAAREKAYSQETAGLVRQRPEIAREIESLAPRIDEAAAAFDERPSPSRGARLRALTLEEIELRGDLDTATAAAGARGGENGVVPDDTAAVPERPN